MSTITLSGNTLSGRLGIGSYYGLGSSFKSARTSTADLSKQLGTLRNKIDAVNTSASVDGSQAENAKTREENKSSALTCGYSKMDLLVSNVGTVDNKTATEVEKLKKDFYKKYDYLKPGKDKNILDWIKDGAGKLWDGLCKIGNAIKNIAISVGKWVKDHWKEILKAVAVVLLVVASVLLLIFVPGGGLLSAILLGAAKGCLIGLATNVVMNGIINKCNGKGFFDGALDAAFNGAVGGFIGGAITGGLVGNSSTMGLLKPAHGFWGTVGQGALVGSTSSAGSNLVTTTTSYFIENGTLKGSGKIILNSVLSGAVTGGAIGGVSGAVSYGRAWVDDKIAAKRAASQSNIREKGEIWSEHCTKRLRSTYPADDVGTEITFKNDSLNAQNKIKIGNRMDGTVGIKGEGGGYDEIKLFEYKATDTAPLTNGQNVYYGNNGNKMVSDVYMTQKGQSLYGSSMIVKAGTEVNIVRPSTIMDTIGVKVFDTPIYSIPSIQFDFSKIN